MSEPDWRAAYQRACQEATLALSGKAAAEAKAARLRSQPCPYVAGNVTRYCTLTPLTLTDAERGAVEEAIGWYVGVDDDRCQQVAATLRGLLERTKTVEK